MLTGSVPASLRPLTEGIGEVAMGLAAGAGAPVAGLILAFGDFTLFRCARGCVRSPRSGSDERSHRARLRAVSSFAVSRSEVVTIPTMSGADVRYAWNHEVALAYQVLGQGPIDLLYMQSSISNMEVNWEHPMLAGFLRELAGIGRLIVADRRGLGCSERFTPGDTPPIETLIDDVWGAR
jgi:hypothetical protein